MIQRNVSKFEYSKKSKSILLKRIFAIFFLKFVNKNKIFLQENISYLDESFQKWQSSCVNQLKCFYFDNHKIFHALNLHLKLKTT